MTSKRHIFEKIVKDENSFTELTYNLLRFKPFRLLFLEFLLKKDLEIDFNDISFEDFDTQYNIGKNGQPDLAIINQDIEIYIEVKVYDTPKTKNQPKNYLKHLHTIEKEKKSMIFLVPNDYKETLSCFNDYEDFNKSYPGNDILKKVVYWQDFKSLLKASGLLDFNLIMQEYDCLLSQWFLFLSTSFEFKDLQIMYSSQIPITIKKLTDFIYEIRNELSKRDLNIKDKHDKYFEEHGFYIRNKDSEDILFFGCWLDFWSETNFPIILDLEITENDALIKRFKDICKNNNLNHMNYKNDDYDIHLVYFEKELLDKDNQPKIIDIIMKFTELID